VRRARDLLSVLLSAPREAGTPGAAHARRLLAEHFTTLGFRVEEQRFRFHPASLNAFPLFGAGLGWLTLLLIPLCTLPGPPAWAALASWVVGLSALGVLVYGTALGWSALGGGVREDANLIATRGEEPVRRWIVAHVDTKAQGHSVVGRVIAVGVCLCSMLVHTVLATLRLWGPIDTDIVALAAALALAACGLAARGGLRGETVGARDNGSGLLAALVAAEAGPASGMGILMTGAEEFGLVGARVFARAHGPQLLGAEVVNLDTLDDRGPVHVLAHDPSGARLADAEALRLAEHMDGIRVRRRPFWIFTDSQPLAGTGAAAITVSRLDWSTLKRLHTARDTPDGVAFRTAELVGRSVAVAN
jgi:hypothetical protein